MDSETNVVIVESVEAERIAVADMAAAAAAEDAGNVAEVEAVKEIVEMIVVAVAMMTTGTVESKSLEEVVPFVLKS